MFRRICSTYGPPSFLVMMIAALIVVFALGGQPSRSLLDDDPTPTGPGLNIVLGAGLQGNGSAGAPLDVKNGTTLGQVVQWNGTANQVSNYCSDPSQRYCVFAEFEQFLTNCTTVYPHFVGSASGAASGCSSTGAQGHPGIINLHTGTNATGYARISSNFSTFAFGGDFGPVCAKQLVEVFDLSTAVSEYIIRIGFMDSGNGANSTDAVQAVYDRVTNGNFWALETRVIGVSTMTKCDGTGGTTSAPVAANTWVTLEECVSSDGTAATLSVNGTICATNTTNIPTSTNVTGIGAVNVNNSGTTPADVNFFIDYYMATIPFGVARQ